MYSDCVLPQGTLDRDKVRKMCEIIFHDVDPALGFVTEEDVDEVMMIGEMNSKAADHHITVDEIPQALSTIMAIKKNKQRLHELFSKHGVCGAIDLTSPAVESLLSELNDGIKPSQEDIQFLVNKCGGNSESVDLAHLTTAIEIWYVLVAQGPLPTSVEEARDAGYTDEQIAKFVKAQGTNRSSLTAGDNLIKPDVTLVNSTVESGNDLISVAMTSEQHPSG